MKNILFVLFILLISATGNAQLKGPRNQVPMQVLGMLLCFTQTQMLQIYTLHLNSERIH